MPSDKYLTVDEVAGILRVNVRTVQTYCRKGVIGATKTERNYLIPRESLDEYLKIRR